MIRLIIAVTLVALFGGDAHAADDEIAAKLEQEALAVINAHKAKLDAEDAIQRQKDAELEKQKNLQTEDLKEQERLQEELKKAAEKEEQERLKLEEERQRKDDMEMLRWFEMHEARRKARMNQILDNMRRALEQVDANWLSRRNRAQQQQQLDMQRANSPVDRNALRESIVRDRLREIQQNKTWPDR
jgi:hypothetical protein